MTHFNPRPDAVWLQNPKRRYVPTTEMTDWVFTWQEFRAAGGCAHFNEDQTEIVMTLPPGWKFAIGFQRRNS